MDEPIRLRPLKPRMRPVRAAGGALWYCWAPGGPEAPSGIGATQRAAWDAMQAEAGQQGQPWAGLMHADPAEVLRQRSQAMVALERSVWSLGGSR